MKEAIFLTEECPFPAHGGGRLRDAGIAGLLAGHASVEILCFGPAGADPTASPPPGAGPAPEISRIVRERRPVLERAAYPFRPYVLNGYSMKMEAALRARAPDPGRPGPPALLWVSRLAMGKYIPLARRLGFRVVLDEHNVESGLLLRAALRSPLRWKDLPQAWQCRLAERRFCRQAHAVVATSKPDLLALGNLSAHPSLWLLPNAIDCSSYEPVRGDLSAAGSTILFPGTLAYGPNSEGLLWFVDRVLPRLRSEGRPGDPPARVVVAGANPSPRLRSRLETAGVRLHSNPESMLPHFREAAVVIVPLLSGSGTRLKILEAMAAGRPVVSTSKGAEGLELEPGVHARIADDPASFAGAILELLGSAPLRTAMARSALEWVTSRHDWQALHPLMARLLESVSGRVASGEP